MGAPELVRVFGVDVLLGSAEGVFMPSPNGLFYARPIVIAAGERVIDIGTGSGVLAVAAARRGAHVVATDVDARATAAAQSNARLNGTEVECRVGSLFGDFEGPFDVILANLPNEIVAPEYLGRLAPADARTFAGGEGGNEHLLALLACADRYMHSASRLYLAVHSLTDHHATLRAALARYAVRLLDFTALPVKPFVTEHLSFYQALNEAGVIQLFRDPDGQWCSYGYVYELALAGADSR